MGTNCRWAGGGRRWTSQWITGPEARHDVHPRRAEADAILVGTGTLIADNPSLTARGTNGDLLVPAAEQPIPVVVGDREIPQHARLRQHPALAAHDLTEPIHLRPSEHPDLRSCHRFAHQLRHHLSLC